MKRIVFLTLSALFACSAIAQSVKPISEAIKIVNEKKIIYPKDLNLPENFSVYGVLNLLPEILARPSTSELGNYEIKVDGTSVESFRSMALSNIKIHDVASIEIKESPTSSYSKNGEAGTIDIKLINADDKASGSITLDAAYPPVLLPSGLFLINKKKLEIKVLAAIDYHPAYDKDTETETFSSATGESLSWKLKTIRNNDWGELLRAYLNYRPTENDLFKFTISEHYSHIRDITSEKQESSEPVRIEDAYYNNFRILANTEYKHTFKDKSVLDIEVNYNFSPLRQGFDGEFSTLQYSNNKHTLSGKAEYALPLLSPKSKNTLKLILGSNYNFQFSDDISDEVSDMTDLEFEVKGKYINLAPYTEIEGIFGDFSFKAIGEYQYYRYNTERIPENITSADKNNYTCKLMTAWRFHPKHRLRLILDRKLNTPSQKQLYPYLVYSSGTRGFVIGNPSLEPSITREAKLEYISGLSWGNSSIMIDASVSYLYTDKIIKATGGQTIAGFPYTYMTFSNDGNNKALNTNLMFQYRTGKFTTGISGNIYFNREEHTNQAADYYNYCNISFVSAYNFNKGWDIAGTLRYYGNITTATGKLGDCLALDLTGGKRWKRWSLMGYIELPLTGKARTTIQGSVNTQYIKSYLVEPAYGINLRYQF